MLVKFDLAEHILEYDKMWGRSFGLEITQHLHGYLVKMPNKDKKRDHTQCI